MDNYRSIRVDTAEITPEPVYINRRMFMKAVGVTSLAGLLAACGLQPGEEQPAEQPQNQTGPDKTGAAEEANTFEEITNFNNYYEFSTDKTEVAGLAKDFKTSPWNLFVSGLVENPATYTMEDLLKMFTVEERNYRLRCVEGWSMVIPWMGFSLAGLLDKVKPLPGAKFVRFLSTFDPEQMPGQKSRLYPWPYQEGLRLDEAMNQLTLLATGLYGRPMPNQNGAPIRLVVPWKYGFKSIKSIVKIELVDYQPETLWSSIAPNEYGFYSNVNPDVSHPRWSQASERRIGEAGRRPTLMFNGYGEEVAYLYEGMDLKENY
ncbi:MAG: mononuclear molybdenum enzyme YedY [Chloroflexi bacterium RBG_16_54_18]|nr:MAG: mononuclear molybdenum enzyme YedY [Chloroflexi bacterium RBG_16_54_18]